MIATNLLGRTCTHKDRSYEIVGVDDKFNLLLRDLKTYDLEVTSHETVDEISSGVK